MSGCSVDGCDGKHKAKGLCGTHYAALQRSLNPQRFRDAVARHRKNHPETADAWKKANVERYKAAIVAWGKRNPEKKRAATEKWKAANPEHDKVYYAQHAAHHNAAGKAYRVANKEKERSRAAAYAAAHPEQMAEKVARRRAQKVGATPKWANQFFMREAYDLSRRRTKLLGFIWEVDHIVPLKSAVVCGLHVENNLQVIPQYHNRAKQNRFWPDMP